MHGSKRAAKSAATAFIVRTASAALLVTGLTLGTAGAARAGGYANGVDWNRRYDQNTYLGTHNSYANYDDGYSFPNQSHDVKDQLNDGVRYLNYDLWLIREGWMYVGLGAIPWVEVYDSDNSDDTSAPGFPYFDFDSLEVALAHAPNDWQYILKPFSRYPSLKSGMQDIREWLQANPGDVVTLDFEDSVPGTHSYMINDAISASGAAGYVFRIDRANPGMAAPPGRQGVWDVRKHGYPYLSQMITAGKRLVILPTNYDHRVNTVYGNKSVNSSTWTNPRNSVQIDDFTRGLFLMEHAPDFSLEVFFIPENAYGTIAQRWNDMNARWSRLPQFFLCDFYDVPTTTSESRPTGPERFVRAMNGFWDGRPILTAAGSVTPQPTQYGWNNTDATVESITGTGFGTSARAVLVTAFSNDDLVDGSGDDTTLLGLTQYAPGASYGVTREGTTTVSFAAIDAAGARSDQRLVDVRIDKVLPQISGSLDRQPNVRNWYNAPVTASFTYSDDRSGVDPLRTTPGSITLAIEAANQTITGTVTDKAANTDSLSFPNINIDMTDPTITYTGNNGLYMVDEYINITCTAADELSGVLSHTCEDIIGDAFRWELGSHTYSASVIDNADNTGSSSTSFVVDVDYASLSNLTRRFISNAGVANAQVQMLESADRAEQRGDLKQKQQHLDVYVKTLENHRDHFITSEFTDILIKLARAL